MAAAQDTTSGRRGLPDARQLAGVLGVVAAVGVGVVGLRASAGELPRGGTLAGTPAAAAAEAAEAPGDGWSAVGLLPPVGDLPPGGVPAGALPPGAAGATHPVVPGDTLSGIAGAHGITVEALVEANGLAVPDALAVGDVLVLP
jgi:hypothetical protein